MRAGDSVVVEALVSGRTSGRADGLRRGGREGARRDPPLPDGHRRGRRSPTCAPWARRRASSPCTRCRRRWSAARPGGDAGPGTINTCPTGVVTEGNAQLKADVAKTQFDVDGTGVKVGDALGLVRHQRGRRHRTPPATSRPATCPARATRAGARRRCRCSRTTRTRRTRGGRCCRSSTTSPRAPRSRSRPPSSARRASRTTSTRSPTTAPTSSATTSSTSPSPSYQDGVVAKAIDDVTAQGVDYFTMAYNSNRIVGGRNVNSWEAPAYRSTACPAAIRRHELHGLPARRGRRQPVPDHGRRRRPQVRLSLGWAEPQNGVTDDMDFFALNAAGSSVVAPARRAATAGSAAARSSSCSSTRARRPPTSS